MTGLSPAGASNLAPISAQALAGSWFLYSDGQRGEGCPLQLKIDGRVGSDTTACGKDWLGEAVSGWVSKPDGVALVTDNRRTLVILSPNGDRYRGRTRQGVVLWLERP